MKRKCLNKKFSGSRVPVANPREALVTPNFFHFLANFGKTLPINSMAPSGIGEPPLVSPGSAKFCNLKGTERETDTDKLYTEPNGTLLSVWAKWTLVHNSIQECIPVGCIPPAWYHMGSLPDRDPALDRDPPGQRPPPQPLDRDPPLLWTDKHLWKHYLRKLRLRAETSYF